MVEPRHIVDLAERVTALEAALEAGADRLDQRATAQAKTVLERTDERMRLGGDHTVVALAGATGSGKSSLFNALSGMEISEVGARRPTTAEPTACVWGASGADLLLDWLGVPPQRRTNRESILDADREVALRGLVLLDLPDHDSTAVAHRLEVDRLVELVDLLVWVVDPQKYGDEALHGGYLKRLRGHTSVMLVVLNQIDKLAPDEADTCERDLRRLLDADGLDAVRMVPTSALRGDGVDALLAVLAEVVQRQTSAAEHAAADLDSAGRELAQGVAASEPNPRSLPGADDLLTALASAAGLPVVLDAVTADYRRQAADKVSWPFLRWWRRLRPDPLRRLRLGMAEPELRQLTRSALPASTPSQKARVEIAVRMLTANVADLLPRPWGEAVRAAPTPPATDLSDAIDAAVLEVDLTLRRPFWWALLDGVQVVLAVAAVFGFVWLALIGVLDYLLLPMLKPPYVGAVPLPTLLVLGGLLVGGLLTGVARWLVDLGAGRHRAAVAAQLRRALLRVGWEHIVGPISKVIVDHRTAREQLDRFR